MQLLTEYAADDVGAAARRIRHDEPDRSGRKGFRGDGFLGYHFATLSGGRSMWLEDHFGNGSMLQRNERVKLAASFWNNIGAGMVIGGMAAAFFLDKPQGTWTKIGI